jgi:hypothetical protein
VAVAVAVGRALGLHMIAVHSLRRWQYA